MTNAGKRMSWERNGQRKDDNKLASHHEKGHMWRRRPIQKYRKHMNKSPDRIS